MHPGGADTRALAKWHLLRRYLLVCLNDCFRREPPFELEQFEHCLYYRVSNMTRQFAGMRTLVTIHNRHSLRSHAAIRHTQDSLVFDLNRLQESIDFPDYIVVKEAFPIWHAFLHTTLLHGRVKGRNHAVTVAQV